MSSEIFQAAAPKYWSLDLKCVPIEPGSKRPAKELTSWQGNLAAVPSDSKQKAWLESYASYGIGLLTGGEIAPGFILVGMDVDDDRLVAPIQRLLNAKGAENSGKQGKKGVTIFVRMPKGTRSTTLKGAEGLGSIDVLAGGKLTVMPPSIHPDTQEPYVDWKTSVLDANLAQLPLVTSDELKAIGVAMGSEEILAIMEGTATHDPGVALAARMVAKGVTDEDISAIFTAFLPEGYGGDTLRELPGWIESAREKGFESSGKGRSSLVSAMVQLAQDEGCEFFHDGNTSAYVTVPTELGTATFPVDSGDFRRWLRHRAYQVLGKPAGRNPLSEAVDTLEALALFSSEKKPVFRRVGGDLQRVEIDLGRLDGHVVSITSAGWTIETAARHKLVRGGGFQPLPNPVKGAGVGKLQSLLGLDDEAFRLVLAFLVNALNPKGPYFILLIEGEQGSGKSFLMDIIKLTDLTTAAIRAWHRTLVEQCGHYTANRAKAHLKSILTLAEEDFAVRAPSMPTGLQRQRHRPKKVILSSADIQALIRAAKADEEHGLYYAFPFLAGTRPSEQLGLLWEDVDFEANVIRIRRIQERDGSLTEMTKTEAGTREIPMGAALRAMLLAWRIRCPRKGKELHRVFPGPGRLQPWPKPRIGGGGPLLYQNYRRRYWEAAFERLKLPYVTPYSARHSFISTLQAEGIEVALVAQIAGHANPTVTLGHYTQAVRGGSAAIEALDRAYATG